MTEGFFGRRSQGKGEMAFIDHLEELRWHIIRSLLAVMVFWMQRNNSLKYFCGALYFSVVNYAVLFLMKKYDYDVLVSGVHLSNLIGAGVSIMVSVLLIIGVYFAMSHRHREYA